MWRPLYFLVYILMVILGEWSSEKTIPTSVPRESRTRDRRLSSSTVASITETETSSEQLKPVLDLIDLYYTGQKSLAKSPAVRFHFKGSCRSWDKMKGIFSFSATATLLKWLNLSKFSVYEQVLSTVIGAEAKQRWSSKSAGWSRNRTSSKFECGKRKTQETIRNIRKWK